MSDSAPVLPLPSKPFSSQRDADAPGAAWQDYLQDPLLKASPTPGNPGDAPPGEDLSLHIGWDRFERPMLAIPQKIERYGHVTDRMRRSLAGRIDVFLLGLMEPEKGDAEPEPDDAEETEEDPN